jgi:hypothetical protein
MAKPGLSRRGAKSLPTQRPLLAQSSLLVRPLLLVLPRYGVLPFQGKVLPQHFEIHKGGFATQVMLMRLESPAMGTFLNKTPQALCVCPHRQIVEFES